MSSPQAVAQTALLDAQTAYLVGDDAYGFRLLLSALNHIATKGKRDAERWKNLRAEPDFDEAEHRVA